MNKEKIDYSNMSTEEKIEHFETTVVESPFFTNIIKKITECHKRSKHMTEPRCLIITGDTGFGKTTIGSFYEKDYPRVVRDNGTIIPVLLSSVPSPATIKSMGSWLLRDMGDPMPDRGTTGSITKRLCDLIKECEVELIILDEFQDLIDKDTEKVLSNSADWLKHILNDTGVPMVLMGMPKSTDILSANSQLKRRFRTKIVLKAFKYGTKDGQEEFEKFLIMLEKGLLFPKPSKLYSGEMPFRLFCATRGIIFNVKNLISKAAEMGYEMGSENITMDLLALAYEEELADDALGYANPFRAAYKNLSIPNVTEPSQSEKPGGSKSKENVSSILHK